MLINFNNANIRKKISKEKLFPLKNVKIFTDAVDLVKFIKFLKISKIMLIL